MAKSKRSAEEIPDAGMEDIHPSRKKRMKYGDEDAQLAKIYNDLADEVQAVRIQAAGDLLNNLSTKLPNQDERLDAAETRLIKGLCSGRKAARLGFSIALTEVLRLKLQPNENNLILIGPTLEKLLKITKPEGNVSGQERRDYLLGRRFALQAILESDVALRKELSSAQWLGLLQNVIELSAIKSWLRRECGSMLYEYFNSRGSKLENSRIEDFIESASQLGHFKTPEGVGLWLLIQQKFPEVKLPKGLWIHNDPLSSKDRAMLSKVLLEDATGDDVSMKKGGTRQSSPSFVWQVIFSDIFQREDTKLFDKFWESCVTSTMFSEKSSTERRSLGLQIFSIALSLAPKAQLPTVLDVHIIRCILDQRVKPDRYLFEAAKNTLGQIVALAKQRPDTASTLFMAITYKGTFNVDALTKTKTAENIIRDASKDALAELVRDIAQEFERAEGRDKSGSDTGRRLIISHFLIMVRLHKEARVSLPNTIPEKDADVESWLQILLRTLARFAYSGSSSSSTRDVAQARLISCLNSLMDSPLEQACKAPVFTAWHVLRISSEPTDADENTKEAIRSAKSCLKKAYKRQTNDPSSQAFSMLLALGIMQVYNGEPDAVGVLEDLVACYSSKDDSTDSTAMLVELLLSFLSKPSSLFRKLAEQVFSVLAAEIGADSLQSLIDILAQKESLSGQKELFDDHGDENATSLAENEDDEMVDVEDASDVELVNGEAASEQEDSDENTDSASGVEKGTADDDDDEEAAFDKKLADALGTAGMEDDSDDDGSDMDDEQMMALEPHIATIFKERQQNSSNKKDKKDAKANIVNFKNRVLDLLTVYAKAQSGSILALDLILPLATLTRTTASNPTAEKAYDVLRQYFDTTTKSKTLPQPEDNGACFEVLAAVHEEMKLGGSKLHANACSRSSLFLAKVLVALDREHYQKINEMYTKLQNEWYLDKKSKVQGSVFTEWISWSISTRKHL